MNIYIVMQNLEIIPLLWFMEMCEISVGCHASNWIAFENLRNQAWLQQELIRIEKLYFYFPLIVRLNTKKKPIEVR